MAKKYGAIISQTHWDREWYQPFQGYRTRLVYLVDDLIQIMEKDPDYKHFFFDGATVSLADYLEIRPENRERLTKLIQDGRILIGPWYGMPDEFLVNGESLVRNLLRGHRDCRAFGVEANKAGYICDIFGHNSQMPQILQGFGINNAVCFRGMPAESPAELVWEAADGSQVLTARLDPDHCYSDFYFAVRKPFEGREFDKDELVKRMREFLEYKDALSNANAYILMDGVDHIEAEPMTPWIIEVLNEAFPEIEFKHETIPGFFERLAADRDKFPIVKGEQREVGFKGLCDQLLANVLSSRVDIKKANDACQDLLTRWTEPLNVMAMATGKAYPAGFLFKAWDHLLLNHPHDSICGCSVGQVHRDMHYRFDQTRLIAEEMIGEATQAIAADLDTRQAKGEHTVTVYNPSEDETEQVRVVELYVDPKSLNHVVTLYDEDGNELDCQLLDREEVATRKHTFRKLIAMPRRARITVALPLAIDSVGYRTLSFDLEGPSEMPENHEYTFTKYTTPRRNTGSMVTGPAQCANEFLAVFINGNGTLEVIDKETGKTYFDLLMLEDRADIGEGWNCVRPPLDSVYTSTGASASIALVCDARYQTQYEVSFAMTLPEAIAKGDKQRDAHKVDVKVTHLITLRKGSRRIDVQTTIDNTAKDHVLKVLFPTGLDTDRYVTDTPYDLIERTFAWPDTSRHQETDTHVVPSQGYMGIEDEQGGLAVFTKGLYEYEAYDVPQRIMALTLMRSFYKEVGTDGGVDGQLLGVNVFEYALRFTRPGETLVYKEYGAFKAGVLSITGERQEGTQPARRSLARIADPNVVLQALKASEDDPKVLAVRVVNLSDAETTTDLVFDRPVKACCLANLNEEKQGDHAFAGTTVPLRLGGRKIQTLLVELA